MLTGSSWYAMLIMRINWVPSRVRLESLLASIKDIAFAKLPWARIDVCRKLAIGGSNSYMVLTHWTFFQQEILIRMKVWLVAIAVAKKVYITDTTDIIVLWWKMASFCTWWKWVCFLQRKLDSASFTYQEWGRTRNSEAMINMQRPYSIAFWCNDEATWWY